MERLFLGLGKHHSVCDQLYSWQWSQLLERSGEGTQVSPTNLSCSKDCLPQNSTISCTVAKQNKKCLGSGSWLVKAAFDAEGCLVV